MSEQDVRTLYSHLIDGWNCRDAGGMASLFADNGNIVGFDGSQLNGPGEIEATLGKIFAEHKTPPFVEIVREVRTLGPNVMLLRATVGMAPPGQSELNPALNAIQSMVAVRRDGRWWIELFQNTPAAFHGNPEAINKLTDELRQARLNRR